MAKNKVSPATAGLVGAAVGAVIGAGAVALSDPKNRKKIGKKFEEIKEQGQQAYSDIKDKVDDMASQTRDKVDEAKKAVKSKL